VLVTAAVWVASSVGCDKKFDGPYPCVDGYASCGSSTSCDTDIVNDALNCGGCNQACALGAPCTSSACGTGATEITSFGVVSFNGGQSPVVLGVNSTALFWEDGTQNGYNFFRHPLGAGTATPVPTTVTIGGAQWTPQCSVFAVDDAAFYFIASESSYSLSSAVIKLGLGGQGATVLYSASTIPCPNGMAVDASNVYVGTTGGYDYPDQAATATLFKIPVAGGNMTTVTTSTGYGTGFAHLGVGGSNIVFSPQNSAQNEPNLLEAVPAAGGTPTPLSTNVPGATPGWAAFTADAENAYVAGTGCSCDFNDQNRLPEGTVSKIPLDGSPGAVMATISGEVVDIAVGGTSVYVLTDYALYAVPIAGGSATLLAGNLGNGQPSVVCSYGCYGNSNLMVGALAIGPSRAYFVDAPVGELISVAK
jgi:hypothetical protein